MPPKAQRAASTKQPDPPRSERESDTDQAPQGEQYDQGQEGEVRGSLPGEAAAAEDSTKTSGDGPNIVPGPTGTVVDPNDPSIGTLRVKVNSNVTLGNKQYGVDPNKVVEVPDTAEARATLAAGHISLADDEGK